MKKILLKTDQNNPRIKEYREAVEKGKKNYHVLPRGNEWIVKRAGADRANQVFTTQTKAATYAKSVSQSQGTTVFIHRANGTIKERKDY